MSGWVKVHRDMLEHPVMQDDWICRLWMWCLTRANFTPGRFHQHVIAAGEFATSMESAAEQLGKSKSAVWRGLQRLESEHYACIKTRKVQIAKRYITVVTICNWATYQDEENQSETPKKRQRNAKGKREEREGNASETPAKQIEEGKEEQEGKKEILPTSPQAASGPVEDAAKPSQTYRQDFEAFYESYPRKVSKDDAARKYEFVQKRLQAQNIWDRVEVAGYLVERAKAYARSRVGKDPKFTPHPSTWLNQGRYLDDDADWNRSDNARGIVTAGDGQVASGDSVGW